MQHQQAKHEWQTNITLKRSHHKSGGGALEHASFLLAIFDNIVGPKIVHYWPVVVAESAAASSSFSFSPSHRQTVTSENDEHLLHYVAIHTLNGELYQDKLGAQLKSRLYVIDEIERIIVTLFFEASTMSDTSFSSPSRSSSIFSSTLEHEHSTVKTTTPAPTALNAFSLILPLAYKQMLLLDDDDDDGRDGAGRSTRRIFVQAMEHMVAEYRVLAHIKPKRRSTHTTLAVDDLTRSLVAFCTQLDTAMLTHSLVRNDDEQNDQIHVADTHLADCSAFVMPATVIASTINGGLNPQTAGSTNNSLDNDFLVNCITSHIITGHRTIVIGKTATSINRVRTSKISTSFFYTWVFVFGGSKLLVLTFASKFLRTEI